jgi:sec-independent protein translocase protein TatA
MFGLGIPELLIVLALVLVVFGPRRLKNIGSELGNAIKGFRTAVKEEPENKTEEKIIEGNPEQEAAPQSKQDQRG